MIAAFLFKSPPRQKSYSIVMKVFNVLAEKSRNINFLPEIPIHISCPTAGAESDASGEAKKL